MVLTLAQGLWWALGYFIPLSLILLHDIGNRHPAITHPSRPFSWILLGRNKFAATGFIAAMVTLTHSVVEIAAAPRPRSRYYFDGLHGAVWTSVWPFLAPAFNQKQLAALVTNVDANGVCYQSTDYTCGPASAVTGSARKLGFKARRRWEIALARAYHFAATGTPPEILAQTAQCPLTARRVWSPNSAYSKTPWK